MEERFDGAAKAFATEVPRRQALRRIGLGAGAAMAALVFPGSAQAASKACPPKRGTPCHGPGGTFTCCPTGKFCCNGSCCSDGETCCGGNCCPEGSACCGSSCCPSGHVCCGSVCCQVGEICVANLAGASICVPL